MTTSSKKRHSKPKSTWANHPHSKAVTRWTLSGEKIDEWDSIGLAVAHLREEEGWDKAVAAAVGQVCRGILSQSYGYKWSYAGEELPQCDNRTYRTGSFWGWNKITGEVRQFSSLSDAAEELLGKRNNGPLIAGSLRSPLDRKHSVKRQWYFVEFLDDVPLIVPAVVGRQMKENAKEMSAMSPATDGIPIRGISVTDPTDVREFPSCRAAAADVAGDAHYCNNILTGVSQASDKKRPVRYGFVWERLDNK